MLSTIRTVPQKSVNSFSSTVLSENREIERWLTHTPTTTSDHTHQNIIRIAGESIYSNAFCQTRSQDIPRQSPLASGSGGNKPPNDRVFYWRVTVTHSDGETSGNRVFKDRAKAEQWAKQQE
jgi:hypothetical protein